MVGPMSLRCGEGLVLSVKPFGERDALVEILCAEHGRLRGLVKGGRSARGQMAAALQPFNNVRYEHFRRLDGQLGTLTLELSRSRASVWLGGGAGAYAVPYVSEVLCAVLPEEHVYDGLWGRVAALVDGPLGWRDVVGFDLWLLEIVGYGLPLREVVGEGEVAYVSPASGRPVGREMAKGWEHRLLHLPPCLGGPECTEVEDLVRAWRLAGHFITKAVHGRELAARGRLLGYYERTTGEQGDALAA